MKFVLKGQIENETSFVQALGGDELKVYMEKSGRAAAITLFWKAHVVDNHPRNGGNSENFIFDGMRELLFS